MPSPTVPVTAIRLARLGMESIELVGLQPSPGEKLAASFEIPPARGAAEPLRGEDVCRGLRVVSTLPNIHKHACLAQIVILEETLDSLLPQATIAHVSSDPGEHWREVDLFHPGVRSAGYSLSGADEASRDAFALALGVGVRGHHRIAHGLFGLLDGRFLAVEIPSDQMTAAPVQRFALALAARVAVATGRRG